MTTPSGPPGAALWNPGMMIRHMELRKHQSEFEDIMDRIVAGAPIRTVIVNATPGAGKSTLPIQAAARLIPSGFADRICWIAPRASLQDQAERNFIDPFFRKMFGHRLTIRSSTNEVNPSRDTEGFCTTYQALGVDDQKTVLRDFGRFRYILVLDEFHHLEEAGEWTEPIRELYERAAFRVLMSGTMSRGDEKRIAFLPYRKIGEKEFSPAPDLDTGNAFIHYPRSAALDDRAIIPLEFHFADGVSTWMKTSGRTVTAKLSTDRHDANQALYTALKTEYAEQLLTEGVAHWKQHRRQTNPNGSLLVVAASIETAKEYTATLQHMGLHAEIATSDDTPHAVKQIKALKAGKLKGLVSVAMAYEGLDVPSISHIICLTNVRSKPWIEQMIARAVRIDPLAGPYETQKGYIFAPADRMFMELARKIEADQTEVIAKDGANVAPGQNGNLFGEPGPARPTITPLSSRMLRRTASFDFGEIPPPEKTPSEIEEDLRKEIDRHVKGYCRAYGVKIVTLNRIIKERYDMERDRMTSRNLEAVKEWLAENYPVPQRREPDIVLAPVGWG